MNEDGEFRPSEVGERVAGVITDIPKRFGVGLDAWVMMPNHVHAILVLGEGDGATAGGASPAPTDTLSGVAGALSGVGAGLAPPAFGTVSLTAVVGAFKSLSARASGGSLWQRSFYDHVVRDADDLARIRRYIVENPLRWALDELNPDAPATAP